MGRGAPGDLLRLVFARPREAARLARQVLAGKPTAYEASIAHQALGVVQRDFGDLSTAITHLRRALRLAEQAGSAERQSDVRATLGIAIVHTGQTRAGLAVLDRAVADADGEHGARVRFRRGAALWVLGRHDDALADLRVAVPLLRKSGDTIWTARALTLRGHIELGLGAVMRADADFARAERLFANTDQDHDSAVAVQNRGLAAFRAGDLPTALTLLGEANHRFRLLGTPMPELIADRCAVLLAAGLPQEALAEADTELADMARRNGQATRKAELLLTAGHAALAAGGARTALDRAAEAVALFTSQRRTWWRQHARLLHLRARFAVSGHSASLLAQAAETARRLDALNAPGVLQAHLLAGRTALALGRRRSSTAHLLAAARWRNRGTALSRVDGWLAVALLAASTGDTRRTLTASGRGLDLLDEHRLTLGAPELRARATAQGLELAALAQTACLRHGRARQLLSWSERWRATACAVPSVHPPADPGIQRDLVALRELTSRIDQARANGAPAARLIQRTDRLERRIQDRVRRTPGDTEAGARTRLDVTALLDTLGEQRLFEIVAVDGDLHVLVCGDGRVRRVKTGTMAAATAAVEAARWVLRRLAYGPGAGRGLFDRLRVAGEALQEILFGAAAKLVGDGPVVIVPPGRLQAVPWAALPCLTGVAHSVAPSAIAWLNAKLAARPERDKVVLVGGPGLVSRAAELSTLTGLYEAQVLRDGAATPDQVLAALDGSSLAHVAAHGRFRADSPLFSSIRVDSGSITGYDFERLRRAPFRIVLSSCDSGSLQPVGADELLGLATALLPLGTAGIVASLVQVNDEATVPLMLGLHDGLRRGETMAKSLAVARREAKDDPVCQATAWSFVALGAA
ncbi:CHAT domain-containing protein [Amycolatopsis xylanica]|uniref:CHAT domain-containing protein n=1 Tax=Amycolatopsis xylanica TaxID=589385 RepID=A0A1H2W242_9PSEU|nr:CHAT domain-containing protein [Amycolatopsis xylanica]SDW74633.1 CHAT domain-containing protein [Amycolatopsis xylanica]